MYIFSRNTIPFLDFSEDLIFQLKYFPKKTEKKLFFFKKCFIFSEKNQRSTISENILVEVPHIYAEIKTLVISNPEVSSVLYVKTNRCAKELHGRLTTLATKQCYFP